LSHVSSLLKWRCNTLQHTATHCNNSTHKPIYSACHTSTRYSNDSATRCNTLRRTATTAHTSPYTRQTTCQTSTRYSNDSATHCNTHTRTITDKLTIADFHQPRFCSRRRARRVRGGGGGGGGGGRAPSSRLMMRRRLIRVSYWEIRSVVVTLGFGQGESPE